MLNRLKVLYRKLTTNKTTRSILLIVVLPIITLRLLGLLQSLEWTAYDLLFYFSPTEPRDERIVLVTWDEQDLQASKEATISDQKLVSVLEKIKAQEPRLIGLDLYRDLPVLSRLLEKKENEQAYIQLQNIFQSTPNLIGIEKLLKPKIAPPPALDEELRVFPADLITDSDNIVRRSFIGIPTVRKGEDSTLIHEGIFHLGTVLGSQYLVEEGFDYKISDDGSLIISKDNSEILLENIKEFDGGYIAQHPHQDFLINWRRGNDLFEAISVDKLLNGEIPPDIFKDKVVLIGNIASSTSDRHVLPTTRWNKIQPWTYGLYIPTNIASSIISAALDGRLLIQVAPWGSGYLLLGLAISSISYVIFRFSELRTQKLYFLSALFSLVLTILLSLGSLLAFQFGYWIPIIPAILGIWLTFLTLNYEVQINREKEILSKFKLLIGHVNHEIGNSTYAIQMNTDEIELKVEDAKSLVNLISEPKSDEFKTNDSLKKESSQNIHELAKILEEIQAQTLPISQKIQKISRHRERTKHYIQVTSFLKKRKPEMTIVNDFVQQSIEQFIIELQSEYETKIEVKQIYDSNLSRVNFDRSSLEIILKNLLENAFRTLLAKIYTDSNHNPMITVETKQGNHWIEIVVEDNGQGIAKALRNEIFKLGVSGRAAAQGQGIGLFLVKELLGLEGGKIELESRIGEGSKFTVFLPRKFK